MDEYTCNHCDTEMVLVAEDEEFDGWMDVLYCPQCDCEATRQHVADEYSEISFAIWKDRIEWTARRNQFYFDYPDLSYQDFAINDPPPPIPCMNRTVRLCAACGTDISEMRKQATTCSSRCRKALSRSLKV